MTPYEKIAQAIIDKQASVLGKPIAFDRARKTKGLNVEEDGRVVGFSGGAEVIEELVQQYAELLGPAAISFSKDAALPIIKQNPGLALPRALL